ARTNGYCGDETKIRKNIIIMVEEIKQSKYVCGECKYQYKTIELQEKCEQWCKTNHSCNLEIISQGIPPKENI
ncbi:MAG: hypothetical protein O3C23_02975, partial [bacterium]|nr:hypothetical protein [bacterium]